MRKEGRRIRRRVSEGEKNQQMQQMLVMMLRYLFTVLLRILLEG